MSKCNPFSGRVRQIEKNWNKVSSFGVLKCKKNKIYLPEGITHGETVYLCVSLQERVGEVVLETTEEIAIGQNVE